jgi:hypothetical protein
MRESRTYGSVRGARDEIRVPTATTHGCRVASHIDRVGQGIDGSANAPKATAIRSGRTSAYQNTEVPQSGQK